MLFLSRKCLYRLFEFFTVTQNLQCWHYCQLCIPICLQFSPLLAPTDVSKLEIRNQGTHEDYISRLHALLDQLIFNYRAKTKLEMLPFLYLRASLKNSIDLCCSGHASVLIVEH